MAQGESASGKVAEGPGEVTYDVLAQKVEVGTEAEAAKAVADAADAKGKVLATAHIKYTHQGGPALTEGSDVHDGTTVFADGQRGGVLIGAAEDAPGCEDPYDAESWKQGESHVFCETYVIPAGARASRSTGRRRTASPTSGSSRRSRQRARVFTPPGRPSSAG